MLTLVMLMHMLFCYHTTEADNDAADANADAASRMLKLMVVLLSDFSFQISNFRIHEYTYV